MDCLLELQLSGAIHRGRWLHVLAMLGCVLVFMIFVFMVRNIMQHGVESLVYEVFFGDLFAGVLPWGWLIDSMLPLVIILVGETILSRRVRRSLWPRGLCAIVAAAALSLVVHDMLYRAGWLCVGSADSPWIRRRWVVPVFAALRAVAFWGLLALAVRIGEQRKGRRVAVFVFGSAATIGLFAAWFALMPIAPANRITVSVETTAITGPLKPDGMPDYAEHVNRRFGKGVTRENNAAVLLMKALGPGGFAIHPSAREVVLRRLGVDELPPDREFFASPLKLPSTQPSNPFAQLYMSREDRAALSNAISWQPFVSAPWKASAFPGAAECIRRERKALDLVVAASRRSRFFIPLVFSEHQPRWWPFNTPRMGACLDAANLLAARAMQRCEAGEIEAAWQDILALFRLSRLLARNWTTLYWTVALAIEDTARDACSGLIKHGKLSAAQYRSIIGDLRKLEMFPSLMAAVEAGSLLQLDLAVYVAHGRQVIAPRRSYFLDEVDWDELMRAVARFRVRHVERMRGLFSSTASGAPDENRTDLERWNLAIHYDNWTLPLLSLRVFVGGPRTRRLVLTCMVGSDVLRAAKPVIGCEEWQQISPQIQARLGLMIITVALEAYRHENGGLPETLALLIPRYLPELPRRQLQGHPVAYKHVGGKIDLKCTGWTHGGSVARDLGLEGGYFVAE